MRSQFSRKPFVASNIPTDVWISDSLTQMVAAGARLSGVFCAFAMDSTTSGGSQKGSARRFRAICRVESSLIASSPNAFWSSRACENTIENCSPEAAVHR